MYWREDHQLVIVVDAKMENHHVATIVLFVSNFLVNLVWSFLEFLYLVCIAVSTCTYTYTVESTILYSQTEKILVLY